MTKHQIALHLIAEDMKYHKLINNLAGMELHLEFYPDIATAVQACLAPNLNEQEQQAWNDRYVQLLGQYQKSDQVLELLMAS